MPSVRFRCKHGSWLDLHFYIAILCLLANSGSASNVPPPDDGNSVEISDSSADNGNSITTLDKLRMINQPLIEKQKGVGFLDSYLQQPSDQTGFAHGFVASFAVIVVSEIADKTFFIAAIMAMRHSRIVVFLGAISALAFMTVLSVFLGYATTIIPRIYTFYASTALFALFGLRMLREGYYMSKDEGLEEMEEVQLDLKRRDDEFERRLKEQQSSTSDIEAGVARSMASKKMKLTIQSHIFIEALTLTFLAEWGDRSQLATIILGARENAYGVTFGGILGHSICTAMAVAGGRFIAQKISPRSVTLVGGVVFLLFAISALIMGPGTESI